MIKQLVHPETGSRLSFGRNKPKARYPRLSLKAYLAKALPNPPPLWNWQRLAKNSLSQMYLNDSLGDCVIAATGHAEGVFTGNANNGNPIILTNDQIISLYSAIGGYDPSKTQPDGSNPTDNGCDIQTALSYWGTKGLISGQHEIQGYLAVNPSDMIELQLAIFLFENLIFGLELPDNWISPFPEFSGFVWDVAGSGDPNNGHCILGFGFNHLGINVSTWAMEGLMTYAAISKYCSDVNQGEVFTVISQDSINKAIARAPNGFNWNQLLRDFNSIQA